MVVPSVQPLRSSVCLFLEQVGKCVNSKLVMNGERWQNEEGEETRGKKETLPLLQAPLLARVQAAEAGELPLAS